MHSSSSNPSLNSQITHWLDASNIYGSSLAVSRRLRTGRGGQMEVTAGPRGSRATGGLPSCNREAASQFKMCNGCSREEGLKEESWLLADGPRVRVRRTKTGKFETLSCLLERIR